MTRDKKLALELLRGAIARCRTREELEKFFKTEAFELHVKPYLMKALQEGGELVDEGPVVDLEFGL